MVKMDPLWEQATLLQLQPQEHLKMMMKLIRSPLFLPVSQSQRMEPKMSMEIGLQEKVHQSQSKRQMVSAQFPQDKIKLRGITIFCEPPLTKNTFLTQLRISGMQQTSSS
jgi:hypothetical protein